MEQVIQALVGLLAEGESVVSAAVVSHRGSTPRDTGARMLVRKGGGTVGTIGGGLLEATVQQAARELFETGTASVMSFDMTPTALIENEMICGGRVEVLLEYIEACPETHRVFELALEASRTRKGCFLVTALGNPPEATSDTERWLVKENGELAGELQGSTERLDSIMEKAARAGGACLIAFEDRCFFIEPLSIGGVVYLFGAGHVSLHVAALCMKVGFHTVVIDDRREFMARERFPEPAELRLVRDYSGSLEGLEIDDSSYIVIITMGHLLDKVVLEQALGTDAGYIGMIGSRRKREIICNALKDQGFTNEDLKRVHCPVGLEIGAETPEEIAVSIVAELVLERSKREH